MISLQVLTKKDIRFRHIQSYSRTIQAYSEHCVTTGIFRTGISKNLAYSEPDIFRILAYSEPRDIQNWRYTKNLVGHLQWSALCNG